MVHFCHISPTPHLDDFCASQTHHLILAHLVETDEDYVNWYKHRPKTDTIILDNSAFELYKAGRSMFPAEKLVDLAELVGAHYVVMTDFPGEPGSKTIAAAVKLSPIFRERGFGTFFVPQSTIGDIEDYIQTFKWAANSPFVDYIGVSILGVPNAYGVERGNKLQRFLSRWSMMTELENRGILADAKRNGKKIHFLGMVDGPNEIKLCSPRFSIDTWDSSAAIWAGLNGISFDTSPTGLLNGKFEKEVDFNFIMSDYSRLELAKSNMMYINNLCNGVITINDAASTEIQV